MKLIGILLICAAVSAAASSDFFPQIKQQARWWRQPHMVERLGLTADQQKKMDDVFQQSRVRLIDLTAAVDKEEALLEPLMAADQPDQSKIGAEIDRLANARAELEKANAHMLLNLRMVLTADQWRKLQQKEESGPKPRPAK